MKNAIMKSLAVSAVTTVLSLTMLPFVATPVFAEGGLTCEVKLNPDGSTHTECTNTGAYIADPTTDEVFQETVQQTQQAWEQETGYTYGSNVYEQTPAPVHTCQDDGYSADYYWSESAGACVTDYVAPTPVPTPVTTPKPTTAPTSTPKPTVVPTPTPVTTPTPEEAKEETTWNFTVVADNLLSLINSQRIALGLGELEVVDQANTDATQRANESMEFAKETTAYGTTTDGHRGFDDDNWGDNEVLGFERSLTGNETEEEIAETIYNSLTSGLTQKDILFSDRYVTTGVGFATAQFTRRNGDNLGTNVYYSILLGK